MIAEWFTDDDRIVETSWGRFQDTPIFRSLAREHNVAVTKLETIDSIDTGGWESPLDEKIFWEQY